MAKGSNFPPGQLSELPDRTVKEVTRCLLDLAKSGKPETSKELKERIDDYFQFCQEREFRPGIETISCALSVDRTTFWRWCNRTGEWGDICRKARQIIIAFLEAVSLSGRLNPATSIFLLKNWADYQDAISFDQRKLEPEERALTARELPILCALEKQVETEERHPISKLSDQ